jgi:DNA anti-recombination protein RmuC
MSQFLLMPILLGLLLTIPACENKDERILPKLGSVDQVDAKEKSALERDEFVRQAQKEMDELLVKLAGLRKKAVATTGQAKAKLDQQILALEQKQKVAEEKLANMKAEFGEKWKELKSGVTEAIEQFKQSLKSAI